MFKLKRCVFLFILSYLIIVFSNASGFSHPREREDLDVFWSKFKNNIEEDDSAAIAEMMVFPLEEAQIFAKRNNNKGLRRAEFSKVYSFIFNEHVKTQILNSSLSNLEKDTDNQHIHPNAYTIVLEFENGDEKSQMVFFIGQEEGIFKIVYIVFIG